MIEVVRRAAQEIGTTAEVATAYEKISGKTIQTEKMRKLLLKAEATDLIRMQTQNQQDNHVQVWKTNL